MARVTKLELMAVMLEMLDAAFSDDQQVTFTIGTKDLQGLRFVRMAIFLDVDGKQAKIDRMYDNADWVHPDQIRPGVSDCVVAILKVKADPTLIEGL